MRISVKLFVSVLMLSMLTTIYALDWNGFVSGVSTLKSINKKYEEGQSVSSVDKQKFKATMIELRAYLAAAKQQRVPSLKDKPLSYYQNGLDEYERIFQAFEAKASSSSFISGDSRSRSLATDSFDKPKTTVIDSSADAGYDGFAKDAGEARVIIQSFTQKGRVSLEDQKLCWSLILKMKQYIQNLSNRGVRTLKDKSLSYYQEIVLSYEQAAVKFVSTSIRAGEPKNEVQKSADEKYQDFVRGVNELNRIVKIYNANKGVSVDDQRTYVTILKNIEGYINSFPKGATLQGKSISFYKENYVDPLQKSMSLIVSPSVLQEGVQQEDVDDEFVAMRSEITLEIYADLQKSIGALVADTTKSIGKLIEGLGVYNAQKNNDFYKELKGIEKSFEVGVNSLRLTAIEKYFDFVQQAVQDFDPLHPTADQRAFSKGAQDIVDLGIIAVRKLILELTIGIMHRDIGQEIQKAVVLSDKEFSAHMQQAQQESEEKYNEAITIDWWKIAKNSFEQFKEEFPKEASRRVTKVLKDEGVKFAKDFGAKAAKYVPDIVKSFEENMSEEDKQSWSELKNKVSDGVGQFTDKIDFGNLSKLYNDDSKATQIIRDTIKVTYPVPLKNKSTAVRVSQGKVLDAQEQKFIANRLNTVSNTLQEAFGINKPLRVALCFSGGGVRSLIGSLGFAKAAARHKLLDVTMYMAGLSGSTWFVAPWSYLYAQGLLGKEFEGALNQFQTMLEPGLNNDSMFGIGGIYGPAMLSKEMQNKLSDYISRKFAYKQPLSVIDIFGPAIGDFALAKLGKNRMNVQWSTMAPKIQSGVMPMPLCAAIFEKNAPRDYGWTESGPFEVGGPQLGYIPIWALGCTFENGAILNYAPEFPLTYYLGMYGSMFALSASELIEKGFPNPSITIAGIDLEIPISSWISGMFEGLASEKIEYDSWITKGISIAGSVKRLNGTFAQFPNFSKGQEFSVIKDKDTLGLFDASISSMRIPLPILFNRNARALDIVIVYDAKDADAESLNAASDYFKTRKIDMPDMSNVNNAMLMSKPMTVFNDPRQERYNPKHPTIIYIPTPSKDISNAPYNIKVDAGEYDHIVTPIDSTKPPYITPNFKYSQDDILNLTQTVEAVVDSQIDAIKSVMKGVAAKKLKATVVQDDLEEGEEQDAALEKQDSLGYDDDVLDEDASADYVLPKKPTAKSGDERDRSLNRKEESMDDFFADKSFDNSQKPAAKTSGNNNAVLDDLFADYNVDASKKPAAKTNESSRSKASSAYEWDQDFDMPYLRR